LIAKPLFFIAALLTALPALAAETSLEFTPWKVVKSDHFIVHYRQDEAFARTIAQKADKDYTRIADDLGYRRQSNFWMWDNRVNIYIYPTREEFKKVPGVREWALAITDYEAKEIHSFSGQPNLIDGVLPHEITHLIFRDFIGRSAEIPLWMNEGVAQWSEPVRKDVATRYVRALLKAGDELPLKNVFEMRIKSLGSGKRVEKFYVQSVSLVDFLIQRFGGERFTAFCRLLRDGRTLEAALGQTYPDLKTPERLESEWRAFAGSTV
jgi:AraC-like DNA-binding protein